MNEQNKDHTPKLIEMPEHIKATLPSARDVGEPAIRGIVVIHGEPGIPVENPSPSAIRRAGTEVMIDGKVGYMLPGQSVEPREEQ